MANPPCLLDVISDPDALNLFFNDDGDDTGGDQVLPQLDDATTSAYLASTNSEGSPASPPPDNTGPATFLAPQPAASIPSSPAGFLSQPGARPIQHVPATPTQLGTVQQSPASVAGSPFGSQHLPSTPSPAPHRGSTPSPMPSPATTPNIFMHQQPLKILESTPQQSTTPNQQTPQMQAQILLPGQKQAVISSLSNAQATVQAPPRVQLLSQVTNANSLQLPAPGMPITAAGGGSQVITASQLPQTLVLANSGQQYNIASASGVQQVHQIQLQSNTLAVNQPQPQIISAGSMQSITSAGQSPSIQAPPNINIMNVNSQTRPQQVIIQQGPPGAVPGKQNVLLTAVGNSNMVRVASPQPGVVLRHPNQPQVILTKGSQPPVLLQQHQLAVRPGGQLQIGNQPGQVISVQQTPPRPLLTSNVPMNVGQVRPSEPAQGQTPTKPAGAPASHIININGRAVSLTTQQIQQLLALNKQKQLSNIQIQSAGGVQVAASTASVVSASSTVTSSKPSESYNQQDNTMAAVQQNIQEIHEKMALQKLQQQQCQQQASQGHATASTGSTLTAASNTNQLSLQQAATIQARSLPGLSQIGGAVVSNAGGHPAVFQSNQAGIVQLQGQGMTNSSGAKANVVTLQAIVQPSSTSKQHVTQFRQILPSTSQNSSHVVSSVSSNNALSVMSVPGITPTLSRPGVAPNVNVQKMGINAQQLNQTGLGSANLQPQGSMAPSSVAQVLTNANAMPKVVTSFSSQQMLSQNPLSNNLVISSNLSQSGSSVAVANGTVSVTTANVPMASGSNAFVAGSLQTVPQAQPQQVQISAAQQGLSGPLLNNVQALGVQPQGVAASQETIPGVQPLAAPPQAFSIQASNMGMAQVGPLANQQQSAHVLPSQHQPPNVVISKPPVNVGNQPQLAVAGNLLAPQQQPVPQAPVTVPPLAPGSVAVPPTGVLPPGAVSGQTGQFVPARTVPGASPQAQQFITQQITVTQPGNPGNARVITIQLTPQVHQTLALVQHKIKILLAIQNRSSQQVDELRQLARLQQEIIHHGRNQANKSQQQLQMQQGVTPQPGVGQLPVQQVAPVQSSTQAVVGPGLVSTSVQNVQSQAISSTNVVQVQPLVNSPAPISSGVVTTFSTGTVTSTAPVSSSTDATATSSTSSIASIPDTQAITDISQLPPQMKEKLRQQLDGLTPSQLDYFMKNQAAILAKLLKHHQHTLAVQRERERIKENALKAAKEKEARESKTPAKSKAGSSGTSSGSSGGSGTPKAKANATVVKTEAVTTPTPAQPVTPAPKQPKKLPRKQVFQHYITKDQKKIDTADYKVPFENRKDILKRLLPYHIHQVKQDKQQDVFSGEVAYEDVAQELLERKEMMVKKYHYLILEDSMKHERTAEMVLLERLFLASEREILLSDRKLAAEEPENFHPTPMIYSSDEEDEDLSKGTDEKLTDSSLTSPIKTSTSNFDPSLLSPIATSEPAPGPKGHPTDIKHSNDTSSDNPQSPGNNYTLHSSKGLKLVFKSSPLHQGGSPAHVTESFSVKSEDSGISSQQNSVETVEEGAPPRKQARHSSEEKDQFKTTAVKVEPSTEENKEQLRPLPTPTVQAEPSGKNCVVVDESKPAATKENLPFTSYKEEPGVCDQSRTDLPGGTERYTEGIGGQPLDTGTDWMFVDSNKDGDLKDLGLSESDSAVANLLNSDILDTYSGHILDDMTLDTHLGQDLDGAVLADGSQHVYSQNDSAAIQPKYEYISEVSDYDTDTNLGDKDQDPELEGALGGLLSDMEQDGKNYPNEMAFNNQTGHFSSDQTSQSEGEEQLQNSAALYDDSPHEANMGGETQSAIDSLLAMESPHEYDYNV